MKTKNEFFAGIVLVSLFCFIQSVSANTVFLDQGVGARALGLGGSFIALADDATAIFWNPAGLSQLEKSQVQTMYVSNIWDFNSLFGTIVFPREFGVFGLAFASSGTSGIDVTSKDVNNRGQLSGSTLSDLNHVFMLTFSKKLNNRIYYGTTLKYITENLYQNSASGYALDTGLLIKIDPRLKFGLNIQNILSSGIKWDTQTTEAVVLKINAGICYFYKNTNLLFDFGSEKSILNYRAGFETIFTPSFKGRFGLSNNDSRLPLDVSLGFGLNFGLTNFDFSLTKSSREGLDDYLSRFSFGFIFGPEIKQQVAESRETSLIMLLLKKKIFESETEALEAIKKGRVKVEGVTVEDPDLLVNKRFLIEVIEP